jgi:hypothetical protein
MGYPNLGLPNRLNSLTLNGTLLSLSVLSLSLICLGSVGHTALVHTLKLLAQTSFLHLALFAFLRVFEVSLVAKFHQVARLVNFTLEATESALDRFTIANFNLDFDRKGGGDCRSVHCNQSAQEKKNL